MGKIETRALIQVQSQHSPVESEKSHNQYGWKQDSNLRSPPCLYEIRNWITGSGQRRKMLRLIITKKTCKSFIILDNESNNPTMKKENRKIGRGHVLLWLLNFQYLLIQSLISFLSTTYLPLGALATHGSEKKKPRELMNMD